MYKIINSFFSVKTEDLFFKSFFMLSFVAGFFNPFYWFIAIILFAAIKETGEE